MPKTIEFRLTTRMPQFILALAILLLQLFPVDWYLYTAFGVHHVGSDTLQGHVILAIRYGIPLAASGWMLHCLEAARFVRELKVGLRWVTLGLTLYAVYFFLAIGSNVLGAIFFGPGGLSKRFDLLLLAGGVFLLVGVSTALCSELPRARLRGTGRI